MGESDRRAAGRVPERVARRKVFYIPGYDPFPARRYRELYRKEGAAQAEICGYEIRLAANAGGGGDGWTVTARTGGREVRAEFEVLIWSDIVAASMGASIAATYGQMLRTAWTYIGSGAIFRLARLRKGPTIAALYPIAALLLQALGALAAGWLAASSAGWIIGLAERTIWPDRIFSPLFYPAIVASLAIGAAAAIAVLRWFKARDGRLYAYYLMHDYAFTASEVGAMPPTLEPRMAEFGDRIAAALGGDWDEVLVVGHSSGAHLAVGILADLIRAGRVAQGAPPLAFLSLGQVVPMVSFLPRAGRLRGDLAFLSMSDRLTWVDVTAPGDGCAYALCDPVSVSGLAGPGKRWPLVLSAAFTRTLSPERWRALRWRFFRLHFQYLCAFDRPGDYDYFQITAGPLSLRDRYRGRAPSQSRIETAMSGYRDTS